LSQNILALIVHGLVPYGEYPAGGGAKDNDFKHCQYCINLVVIFKQCRYDRGIADNGNTRQDGNANKINKISILDHTEPGPSGFDTCMFKIVMDIHGPVVGNFIEWNVGI